MDIQLAIENPDTGKIYLPTVEEGVEWTTDRIGTPGSLEFSVVKDSVINFQEGNRVQLKIDGKPVFLGFVFKKKRSKDGLIAVTAYDQLRYFKNKDVLLYTNKKASEMLMEIAKNYSLLTGEIEDTKYIIHEYIAENTTLFDAIQNVLDKTLTNTKQMYVLYDDFGLLTLKNIANMRVPYRIDATQAQDYDYETSIDSDTYNKIKLMYKDSETNEIKVFPDQDDDLIKKWGVLQYFDTIDNTENAAAIAKALLELYGNKSRSLSMNGVFGDLRVRAGCQVPVFLNLGDVVANNWLIVEKCTHTFRQNEHTMDLELKGGEYIAG